MRKRIGLVTACILLVFGATTQAATTTAAPQVSVSEITLAATQVDGIAVTELSGLAWDADAALLYAVSDQGYLYQFAVQRQGSQLVSVQPLAAVRLVDAETGEGAAASNKHFNAEGLTIHHGDDGVPGNTELIVALEEKPPQIGRFAADGRLLERLPVPPPADDIDHYQKKGRGLESVALHPEFGLLTAPEAPLKTTAQTLHAIYAADHAWSFPRHANGSRLKGFDVLPGGNLLVLERARPSGSKHAQVASLRYVNLADCQPDTSCSTRQLAAFDVGAHNFEGMALLDPAHILIASDNGGGADEPSVFMLLTLE